MNLEMLKVEFLKLSPQEQEAFCDYVSTFAAASEAEPEAEIMQAWKDETRHRLQEYREGKAVFYPAQEVIAELRAEHGL